jgi:hypothetical protein
MHRAFAAWLIAKPWRAFLLTAILGVLSPQGMSPLAVAAGAIPVLIALARDGRWGLQVTLAGAVTVCAYLLASGQSFALSLASVCLLFFAPFGLALIVQRTGSLLLSLQLSVVGAGLLLAGVFAGLENPVARWRELVQETVRQFVQFGLISDTEPFEKALAGTNWGTYIAFWLITILGSLFLGCWWHSLTQAPGAFGKEFRQLRLGKTLGVAAVVTVVTAFVLDKVSIDAPFLDALVWIAIVPLACQGLSAAHRLKANGRVGVAWLVMTYLLLIFAAPITAMVLAGWGVVDNWRKVA